MTPSSHADALRELLNEPAPKSDDWQAAVGRAVGVLAVGLLNETDDRAALRSVGLITLAQIAGSKDAKKRALKLSRWAEVAPPPLTALRLGDERAAAVSALARLTVPWALGYIQTCLADPEGSDDLVPDLMRWARSTFADPTRFADDWYSSAIKACTKPQRWATLLKEALRSLKVVTPRLASSVASAVSGVVAATVDSPAAAHADDKLVTGVVACLLGLIQDQCASAPALLLQPALPVALGQVERLARQGGATKQVTVALEHFSLATVSLLAEQVVRDGETAISRWQPLVPTWRAVYPKFEQHLEAAASELPVVRHWVDGKPAAPSIETDVYAGEAVFARLLPAFQAFVAELPDPGRAASLSATLAEAAALAGVEALGVQGEVLDLDPLAHQLAEEGVAVPQKVRVVRSGVQARRPDGSTRVLVHALVTPA